MAIVVVGNVFVDIKGFPDGVYIPAGRNSGQVVTMHGGVGRNIAEDIANLELHPKFVSMVDESDQGRQVVEHLRSRGVNTDYVAVSPEGMGIWLAVFDAAGDIAASISHRPEMDDMVRMMEEKGDEIFADADSILVEIDNDRAVVEQVFRFAEKYGKKVYAVVANMSIAVERRDFLKSAECTVCNVQEADILFAKDYSHLTTEQLRRELLGDIRKAGIPALVVTLGENGAVYAEQSGNTGYCPARTVHVQDTTGAGDAFFAGVAAGLTYGNDLGQSVAIGTRLASAVITVPDNVCPRFLPEELGLVVENGVI